MCDKHWVIRSLAIGTLVLGSATGAAAQGNWRSRSGSAGQSSYYRQPYSCQPNRYLQPSGSNSSYMYHYVGRALRHNAYQQARLQGMQIRLQQERVRAELAWVKHQNKIERKYASLKMPQSSWRSANSASLPGDSVATQPTVTTSKSLLLDKQDVEALRTHYDALAEIQVLRREQIIRRSPRKQVTRPLPSQFDRESGSVSWPALLTDNPRFREDVQHMNRLLADWAQYDHDPTSLAAIQVRKTIGRMTRDLLTMQVKGHIDKRAYDVTREFLENTAYETQFSRSAESGHVTDTLASTH